MFELPDHVTIAEYAVPLPVLVIVIAAVAFLFVSALGKVILGAGVILYTSQLAGAGFLANYDPSVVTIAAIALMACSLATLGGKS